MATPQRGFFDGFRNFFRGGRAQRPRRPRPNQGGAGANAIAAPAAGGGSSGGRQFHTWNNVDYLVSWRQGRRGFGHGAAAAYCRQNGMKPISLDSAAKAREFMNLVQSENEKYFWTGGRLSPPNRQINWANGRSTGAFGNWSPTGGARRPQPDNREGNEFCVGVLNNFYRDGVKYHDIACHHRKPVICEP